MSPSSTVHGGQHETKYVTFELLLIMHATFVADEIWGFMPNPARIICSYRCCGIIYANISKDTRGARGLG